MLHSSDFLRVTICGYTIDLEFENSQRYADLTRLENCSDSLLLFFLSQKKAVFGLNNRDDLHMPIHGDEQCRDDELKMLIE